MCPPPCGPRRSSRRSSTPRVTLPPIKTYISKRDVDKVIDSESFDCRYMYKHDKNYKNLPFEGDSIALHSIVHKGTTSVKIAGRKSYYYSSGYKTIIVTAPESASLYIRIKEL